MKVSLVVLMAFVALGNALPRDGSYGNPVHTAARYRIPAQRTAEARGYRYGSHGNGGYGTDGFYGNLNAYANGNVHGNSYGGGNVYGSDHGTGNAYGYQNAYGDNYNSRYQYHGRYGDACNADGLYYRNARSYVVCTKGQALVRPCAPGTENSGYNKYVYGNQYSYTDFCDVNLNDYGYGATHPRPHGYVPAPNVYKHH